MSRFCHHLHEDAIDKADELAGELTIFVDKSREIVGVHRDEPESDTAPETICSRDKTFVEHFETKVRNLLIDLVVWIDDKMPDCEECRAEERAKKGAD